MWMHKVVVGPGVACVVVVDQIVLLVAINKFNLAMY